MESNVELKNTLIYLLPRAVSGFLPLFTLPIFTSKLSKADFGAFALAEIYAILMTGIVNFGLVSGYERNFFQYDSREKRAQLLYSTLAFVFCTFLTVLAASFIFRFQLAKLIVGSREYAGLLFLVLCSTCVMSFKQYYLLYFRNVHDAKSYAMYSIDETVLGVVFSVALVVYFKTGIIGLAWGQLAASLMIFSLMLARFSRALPFSLKWDVLKDSLKISYPLTPRIFTGVLGTQMNKYLLGLMGSIGGVGVFRIGQKIALAVFTYMTAVQNVFNPGVYKRMFDSHDNGKEIGRYLTPFLYFSVVAALLVALFSEEIVRILTPAEFKGAATVVSILSMYYAVLFFGKVTGTQLIFSRKTFISSALSYVDIGITFGFCFPLIRLFGIEGAAWATLASGVVSGTIWFLIAQRFYPVHWEYKKAALIFASFYIPAALIVWMMHFDGLYPARLALKTAALAGYLYLGNRLGLITRETLRQLAGLFIIRKPQAC